MKQAHKQRGFLLIVAAVLIAVAAVMAAIIVTLTAGSGQAGGQHVRSTQALFVAESGMERAGRLLLSPVLAERVGCAAVTGNVNVTNIAVGQGRYTVTGGVALYPATAPTLNGALIASATLPATIPFNSVLAGPNFGMAAAGRILVDRETIDYSGISTSPAICGVAPRCFTGVQRARVGTTAAAHVNLTPVGHYQCDLISMGGVPDLAAVDRAQRTLAQGVQLQEGWIVGAPGGVAAQRPLFFRWNAVASTNTWTLYNSTALNINTQLNSISMLSSADGWAVGNAAGGREILLSWNGVAWVLPAASVAIDNRNLNGVYCISTNDCWAVGVQGGAAANRPWIVRKTATWANYNSAAMNANATLNSVFCFATNDCWAVGNPWNPPGPPPNQGLLIRWNGATWTAFVPAVALPNVNFNSVHCVATNDCWAVGNAVGGNEVILRWNGVTWTRLGPLATVDNRSLTSVYCVSTADCWAVGAAGPAANRRPWLIRWNGATWNNWDSTAINVNTQLNSVFCVGANDCWAVGNAVAGGEVILHWDGIAWTRLAASAALPNVNLRSVYIIGARQRPASAWREVFP